MFKKIKRISKTKPHHVRDINKQQHWGKIRFEGEMYRSIIGTSSLGIVVFCNLRRILHVEKSKKFWGGYNLLCNNKVIILCFLLIVELVFFFWCWKQSYFFQNYPLIVLIHHNLIPRLFIVVCLCQQEEIERKSVTKDLLPFNHWWCVFMVGSWMVARFNANVTFNSRQKDSFLSTIVLITSSCFKKSQGINKKH